MSESESGLFEVACKAAREWNYNDDTKIPLGIFFRILKPVLPEKKEIVNVDKISVVQSLIDRAT